MSLYNYVDTPNSNLICCICRAPFTDPFTTRTCAHTFCYECILRALSHSGAQCPVDRSALSVEDLYPANPIVRSLVDELIVECIYAGEGCKYTCERQRMVGHLKEECEYAEMGCNVSGCGEVMRRRDVAGHVERVHMHAEEETGDERGEGEEVQGGDVGREEVYRCPHAAMGCVYEGEEGDHLAGCVYEQLKGFFVANTARLAVLTEQNVMLRHRAETLEGTVETLRKDLGGRVSGLETRVSVLGEEMGALAAAVDGVGRRSEMALTNETLRLSEEMMSVRGQLHGVRMQMHGMMMDREHARNQHGILPGSITKL